jgi:hypothetical protein
MLDQAANLICQQRFPMLGRAAELYRFLLVSHREISLTRYSAALPAPLELAASSTPTGVSTRPGSNFIPRPESEL